MKKISFALLLMLLTSAGINTAQAQQNTRYGFERVGLRSTKSVLPPNNLHMQDRRERTGNISEKQFGEIIDGVAAIWAPLAKSKGVDLVFQKNWDDPTVNAQASQQGNVWMVEMFGGLARRPEVTPEGFALVVCHELGHHFAGYPFVDAWAANEGQSDYFATQVCLKSLWGREFRGNESFRRLNNIPDVVKVSCGQAWENNANAQGWCVRAAAAGQSLANLFASARKIPVPNFGTPDKNVVKATNGDHPAPQCRLDTYLAGALCTKGWDMNVIPGKGQGNTLASEIQAMQFSCMEKENFTMGTRPRCWFKPLN